MFKFLMVLFLVSNSFYVLSMQQISPLLALPIEVQDLIATYLIFDDIETDQEFIERTKYLKKEFIPEWTSNLTTICQNCTKKKIIAFCPQKRKLGFIHSHFHSQYTINSFTLLDAKTQQLLHQCELHERDAIERNPTHLAISLCGNIVATIYDEATNESEQSTGMLYKKFVTIQNLTLNKKQQFLFPLDKLCFSNEHPLIAFNKQGTILIIQSFECDVLYPNQQDIPTQYIIIPITILLEHSPSKRKTLQYYFNKQFVCKGSSLQNISNTLKK